MEKKSKKTSNKGETKTAKWQFWFIDDKGNIKFNNSKFGSAFLGFLGFVQAKINGIYRLAQIKNNIIKMVTREDIARDAGEAIQNDMPYNLGEGITREALHCTFLKGSKNYLDSIRFSGALPKIDVDFLYDDEHSSYIPFQNCVLKITAEAVQELPYNGISKCIWENQILKRNFTFQSSWEKKSAFEQFVNNVCKKDELRFTSLKTIIGYLLHRYKNPSKTVCVILMDEKIGDVGDANGGSGKSLVAMGIGHIRSLVNMPGKTFRMKKNFALQRVNDSINIILINDAVSNDSFEDYYNIITDDIVVEQKHKGEITIPFEHSPKLIITTNFILRAPDGNSTERRKVEFEFSDFYNGIHTPIDDFKQNFFYDWSKDEWNFFDNFMVHCLQLYLQKGIVEPPQINIKLRRLYSEVGVQLVEFLDEKIKSRVVKFQKKDTYDEFLKENPDQRKYISGRNAFTTKLKKYFDYKGIVWKEIPVDTKKYFEIIPPTDNGTAPSPIPQDDGPAPINPTDVEYNLIKPAA